MKPQKQLNRHRPDDGVYGDCHRTAIAIALDMNAEDVPHYMDASAYDGGGEGAHNRFEAWLNARGICTISVLYPGEMRLSDVLNTVSLCNPRSRPVFILGGQSRNGCNHSVVCCDGEIACDPSQDDSGIVGPCDDGYYWLTFFGALEAAHPVDFPFAEASSKASAQEPAPNVPTTEALNGAGSFHFER